jgi:hypothetical protein
VAENKILTWKNLQKRGWVGPGICHLCKGKRESGKHLFVNCPFTISVWNRVKIALKFTNGWNGLTVNECFENWAKQNFDYPTLPTFICWFIWLDRNKTIFESGTPSIQKIVFLAIGAVSNYRIKEKDNLPRISTFEIQKIKSLDGSTGQRNRMVNKVGQVA